MKTQYFARPATSGFIRDAQKLKEHWRKKACLDAKGWKCPNWQFEFHPSACWWRLIWSFANFAIPWWHDWSCVDCGCVDATTTPNTAAWKKALGNYPGILLRNWGNIFNSCIRKSLMYGCKTWPVSSEIMSFNICWQRYGSLDLWCPTWTAY